MRIEHRTSEYHPHGDFIIYAEGDKDRALLRTFIRGSGNSDVVFKIHSYGGKMGNMDYLYFGWCEFSARYDKKRSRKRSLKQLLFCVFSLLTGLIIGRVVAKQGKEGKQVEGIVGR
jgi:hypothetical protein